MQLGLSGPTLSLKARRFHAAVPLLDTLKDLHIWYTTITTSGGWWVLELNNSSVVIGYLKSGLISAQLISA
jgi:hypothetical protein